MRSIAMQAFLVFTLMLAWEGTPAAGQSTNSAGAAFAMIGIASGQTARLNVVNLAALDSANPSSCNATLQFLDAQGNVLKQATLNAAPGAAVSMDLNQSELQTTATRNEVRAVALFGYVGGANPPAAILQTSACGQISPSLEIFDNVTGRTNLILVAYKQLPRPASAVQ